MFPIGDENRGRGLTPVTLVIVLLNVLVFVYQMSLELPELREFIMTYGAIPAELGRGDDLYTVLTSMFVHGGLGHIFGNMLFMVIFADNIERRFGPLLFLGFYLACGLAATGAHLLTNAGSQTPTVGASGAISGVMGAYILLYPLNRVRVLVWYWGILQVPAFIFLGIWFLTQLTNGVAALAVETAQSAGVAFWAHIGGFAAGALLGGMLGMVRGEPPRQQPRFEVWQDRW